MSKFRVATVFTGVAAATAVFVPAATAATTQEAKPDISHKTCDSTTKQWAHLYYTAAERHGPACFGNTGPYYITSNTKFTSLCAGNNSGYLAGKSAYGEPFHFDFAYKARIDLSLIGGPGPAHVSEIDLYGHEHDTYTCPQ